MAFLGEGNVDSLTAEDIRSPVAKFFCRTIAGDGTAGRRRARGDMLLIVADGNEMANNVLDALRRELGKRLDLIDENVRHFAFVTNFPCLSGTRGRALVLGDAPVHPGAAIRGGSARHRCWRSPQPFVRLGSATAGKLAVAASGIHDRHAGEDIRHPRANG